MRRIKIFAVVWAILALLGAGPAGAEPFKLPRPGRVFKFPQDHGAHPGYQTEWWYYSGHLKAPATGETFGYELTFFRMALRHPDPRAKSAWSLNTVYFAHLAVSEPARDAFYFRERAGRGALGLAGAEAGRLKVWIFPWQAEQEGKIHHLVAKDGDLGLDLKLAPLKPPVLHGEGGYSLKSARLGAASYYYSLPRLETAGQLTMGGRVLAVTGDSWMDHEFFTGAAAPDQVGWDWLALQLDDGWDVMLYLLRHRDGKLDAASSGTLIDPRGHSRHLEFGDFRVEPTGTWKSPHSGARYPSGWRVAIPAAGYQLTVTPTMADQEIRAAAPLVTYWEGEVKIKGRKAGAAAVEGLGFVELTGYAGAATGGRF